MGDDTGARDGFVPSLGLLWRLAAVPAALLVLIVVGSLVSLVLGVTISDDRLSALWVLTAALLGTLGAFAAALLTAGAQERTLAHSREESARSEVRDRQEGVRLGLEATIEGITLLQSSGPSDPAVSAGSLAAVVHLGTVDVALRMLWPLARDDRVDSGTAAWVVDQILRSDVESTAHESMEDAAKFLLRFHDRFPNPTVRGLFDWPRSCQSAWPERLLGNAGGLTLYATVDLLVSRSRAWWSADGGDWTWVWGTFTSAYNAGVEANDDIVHVFARRFLRMLLDAPEVADLDPDGGWRAAVSETAGDEAFERNLASRVARLEEWLADDQAAPGAAPADDIITVAPPAPVAGPPRPTA